MLAGSARALQNTVGSGPLEHYINGILRWDEVDGQFHVPLADEGEGVRRKFRIDISPTAMLSCTCICRIFPVCWVHREGQPARAMLHRVIGRTSAFFRCPHGVAISSATPCPEAACRTLHASRLEMMLEHMLDGAQQGAASSSASSSASTPAVPPDTQRRCIVCLEDCVGDPTCRSRGYGPTAWGMLKCCGHPMHGSCLTHWFGVQRTGGLAGCSVPASCPLCREPMSGGSRAWA